MAAVTAPATLADVQYELTRLYRSKAYINKLVFQYDSFFGQLKRKLKKIQGQADVIPLSFAGAGAPSNVEGISGVPNPTKGAQFLVTPVQLTNVAQITGLAAASGASGPGSLVQSLRQEIDGAITKVGRHACIQVWSDGFPSVGQIASVGASTTLTLVDPDDSNKYEVGDILNFAAARTSGALKALELTVVKILDYRAGTMQVDQNTNTGGTLAGNDFIFFKNQRNTAATKIAITGVQGWLQATPGTLFGVDCTQDPRLAGIFQTSSASDIEGAFIDAVATMLSFSSIGTEGIAFYMHPKTWATLAKALQAKSIVIMPYRSKPRVGEVGFSGWQVMTPNGTATVYAPRYCPKAVIFGFVLEDWQLVSWGTDFPSQIPTQLGAAPGIFQDPLTGLISSLVGGYPQLECWAPGHQLTIQLV